MKKTKFSVLIVLAIAMALFISACSDPNESVSKGTERDVSRSEIKKDEKPTRTNGLEVGAETPTFELTKSDGAKFSNESIKGKPAVLVFWSLYCSKCKKETPQINQLAKEYNAKGVEVVGINIGETKEEMEKGVKSFGIEYPVAEDSGKGVMQKFGAIGTPTIVFLDKEGKVRFYGNKIPEDYKERLNSMV